MRIHGLITDATIADFLIQRLPFATAPACLKNGDADYSDSASDQPHIRTGFLVVGIGSYGLMRTTLSPSRLNGQCGSVRAKVQRPHRGNPRGSLRSRQGRAHALV
jgi:hypothetical protein